MNILVTGGAGFIGSHLLEVLVQNPENNITVLDNLCAGSLENVPTGVNFIELDIRSNKLSEVFAKTKFDAVVHLAAQTMVPFSLEHPSIDADINIMGLINVLECCKTYHVQNVVFSSSAAVYGNNLTIPLQETESLVPTSFYGLTKMFSEHYLRLYHELYGLNTLILRFANVYGERQGNGGEGGVISIFAKSIAANLTLKVYGDGTQTRDFIYVGDIAQALASGIHLQGHAAINVSSNSEVSINELIDVFTKAAEHPLKVEYFEPRIGDIYRSKLDNTKLRELLHIIPATNLEKGIAKTYSYFLKKAGKEL